MKISVIIAHPNPKSFNHAIAHAAVAQVRENGHQAVLHDLHAERFDPLLPTGEIPIAWDAMANFDSPANTTQTLVKDAVTTFIGIYVRQTGTVVL